MLGNRIIFIFILFVICISAVSANENITDNLEISDNDVLENNIKVSGNTFDDIQNAIDGSKENDIIKLEGLYVSSNNQVNINKSLTIQGSSNGATLDFKNDDVCFYVSCYSEIFDEDGFLEDEQYVPIHVVLKDLNIINSKGAILAENANLTVINCNFIDNKIPFDDYGGGGAIQINNYESNGLLNVYDSNFINCSGYLAGAIMADNAVIKNSNFTNNYAYAGAAISASNLTVSNSKFSNNRAKYAGGAIYIDYGALCVDNSEFRNNVADGFGSAIYIVTFNDESCSQLPFLLNNSKFDNNVANGNAFMYDYVAYVNKGAWAVAIGGNPPKYSISGCTGLDKTFAKTSITLTAPKVSTTYNSGKTFNVKIIDKNTKKRLFQKLC